MVECVGESNPSVEQISTPITTCTGSASGLLSSTHSTPGVAAIRSSEIFFRLRSTIIIGKNPAGNIFDQRSDLVRIWLAKDQILPTSPDSQASSWDTGRRRGRGRVRWIQPVGFMFLANCINIFFSKIDGTDYLECSTSPKLKIPKSSNCLSEKLFWNHLEIFLSMQKWRDLVE